MKPLTTLYNDGRLNDARFKIIKMNSDHRAKLTSQCTYFRKRLALTTKIDQKQNIEISFLKQLQRNMGVLRTKYSAQLDIKVNFPRKMQCTFLILCLRHRKSQHVETE